MNYSTSGYSLLIANQTGNSIRITQHPYYNTTSFFYYFFHIIVACVRRRGDRPLHSMCVYLENMERQGILVSYQWKNGMGVAT
jgi:hypothetical protein